MFLKTINSSANLREIITATLIICSIAFGVIFLSQTTQGQDLTINVSTREEFMAAAKNAVPGTTIKIAPGTYTRKKGDRPATWGYLELHGTAKAPITITAQDPKNPPVFKDCDVAFQLNNSSYVIISNITVRDSYDNGIQLGTGRNTTTSAGQLSTSHHITIKNVKITNSGRDGTGNHDGIKVIQTDYFTISNAWIQGWSKAGSGIDATGSQHGVIENSTFIGTGQAHNGIQTKGGARNIHIRNNFFKNTGDYGVSCGIMGITYFRDKPGSTLSDGTKFNYECKDIEVSNNRFIGAQAAVGWNVSSGGQVHHNTIVLPEKWVARITGYYPSTSENAKYFAPAHSGSFHHNLIVYNYKDLKKVKDPFINVYLPDWSNTNPKSFTFNDNAWYALDGPAKYDAAKSFWPNKEWPAGLPVKEQRPTYQVDPMFPTDISTKPRLNILASDIVIKSQELLDKNIGAGSSSVPKKVVKEKPKASIIPPKPTKLATSPSPTLIKTAPTSIPEQEKNQPPNIVTQQDTYIIKAGDTLRITLLAIDEDSTNVNLEVNMKNFPGAMLRNMWITRLLPNQP
jgi:hypothetical protein